MKYMIPNPQFPRRQAFSSQINEMLGVKKLPKDGIPMVDLPGVTVGTWDPVPVRVWVDPIEPGPFKLRVLCQCPGCGMVLAVGRLLQHECTE